MTLDQRVEQLESKCRQLRRVLTITMMVIAAFVVVAAAPKPGKDKLQTESIEVVDGDGNVRIRIGPADEGYGLVVYDEQGRFNATLTDAPQGSAMSLRKHGGSIELLSMKDQGSGISIRDQNGNARAVISVQEDASTIMLKDQEDNTVFSAPK